MTVRLTETRLRSDWPCADCGRTIIAGSPCYRKYVRRASFPIVCGTCATGGDRPVRIEPLPGAEIACRHCGEPIYFANKLWRHRSTRRSEALEKRPCPDCGGRKVVVRGRTERRCAPCFGLGEKDFVLHVAEPPEGTPELPLKIAPAAADTVGRR